MTNQTSADVIIEEFKRLTDEDIVEGNGLYGPGSYSEWLENNQDKHLFSNSPYNEPMCDIDADRVVDWLRLKLTKLTAEAQRESERCVEAERERITQEIINEWKLEGSEVTRLVVILTPPTVNMNEHQIKAEKYARGRLMELEDDGMLRCDGCEISYNGKETSHFCECPQRKLNEAEPIKLNDWLRLLQERPAVLHYTKTEYYGSVMVLYFGATALEFNLHTGQPKDWESLCNVLGL